VCAYHELGGRKLPSRQYTGILCPNPQSRFKKRLGGRKLKGEPINRFLPGRPVALGDGALDPHGVGETELRGEDWF
jgi:hypothetical protein